MKSSVKPFGCALCRKGFVTSKSLADHIKRFHEDPKNLPKFDTVKTEKKKKGANNCASNKSRKSKAGGTGDTEGRLAGGASTSPKIKRCRSKTFSLERPSIITYNSNFKNPPSALKSDMIALGLTESKVLSPRILRSNGDVKNSIGGRGCQRCNFVLQGAPNCLNLRCQVAEHVPYSREQKHVSISDTPMLLIEIRGRP